MKDLSNEELADIDRSYRLAKSYNDGVFYDEFMCPIPMPYLPVTHPPETPEQRKMIKFIDKTICQHRKALKGE